MTLVFQIALGIVLAVIILFVMLGLASAIHETDGARGCVRIPLFVVAVPVGFLELLVVWNNPKRPAEEFFSDPFFWVLGICMGLIALTSEWGTAPSPVSPVASTPAVEPSRPPVGRPMLIVLFCLLLPFTVGMGYVYFADGGGPHDPEFWGFIVTWLICAFLTTATGMTLRRSKETSPKCDSSDAS